MKRSTPVIMGIVLILGLAALGYLDQFNIKSNNSSNYPFKYSIPGEQQLNNYENIQQPLANQISYGNQISYENVSASGSSQNSSNNVQNLNITS